QDNDRLNALANSAGMRAEQIAVLRVYSRYLQQTGVAQSQGYIADALNRYPQIASNLYRLFAIRLDPNASGTSRKVEEEQVIAEVEAALEEVPSLDDDTIMRRFITLIRATLRTSHFAPQLEGTAGSLVLKFDPHRIDWLPQPR